MDIITNKAVVAPQASNYETKSAAPIILGRPASVARTNESMLQSKVEEASQPDKLAVENAIVSMQDATQAMQRNLDFSIDDSTGRMVVKVTDSASGEVIRQMPTEEALRLAESLDEMRSLLFTAQA